MAIVVERPFGWAGITCVDRKAGREFDKGGLRAWVEDRRKLAPVGVEVEWESR